jgi:hypothetical protein
VVRQGDGFTFYLDGREIVAARFPVGRARAGLYTEGVRAAFDDVTLKRLVVPTNLLLNGGFETERWQESASAPPTPWRLSNGAQINFCCAHSGSYRLLLTGAGAQAEQRIAGLPAGSYTLWAWVTTRGAEGEVRVRGSGGAAAQATVSGESWRRVELNFEVPPGGGEATISIGGSFSGEAGSLIAADDLYLWRR